MWVHASLVINYEKGVVDVEIPGVPYSGPQAYPEWMIINTTFVKLFKVKVVCMSATGREDFTVLSTEVPRLPPQIAAAPSSLKVTRAYHLVSSRVCLCSMFK